jgi:transcriptional regulator with XRE-family HTH domain
MATTGEPRPLNRVPPARLAAVLRSQKIRSKAARDALARRLRVLPTTLEGYLSGERRLSLEMYRRTLDTLRLPPDWPLTP